jgi:hypothetical protein
MWSALLGAGVVLALGVGLICAVGAGSPEESLLDPWKVRRRWRGLLMLAVVLAIIGAIGMAVSAAVGA